MPEWVFLQDGCPYSGQTNNVLETGTNT